MPWLSVTTFHWTTIKFVPYFLYNFILFSYSACLLFLLHLLVLFKTLHFPKILSGLSSPLHPPKATPSPSCHLSELATTPAKCCVLPLPYKLATWSSIRCTTHNLSPRISIFSNHHYLHQLSRTTAAFHFLLVGISTLISRLSGWIGPFRASYNLTFRTGCLDHLFCQRSPSASPLIKASLLALLLLKEYSSSPFFLGGVHFEQW